MRNDLISLIFSNDDGSDVTMPASQLLDISTKLQELLSAIGSGSTPPVFFILEVAAADRGSFRLGFKWKAQSEKGDRDGLTIEEISKIAQTAFHVVSTVSVFLVMVGCAHWQSGREPNPTDIKDYLAEAKAHDAKGNGFDAAGRLTQSVIVVGADTVILDVPSMAPVVIVSGNSKHSDLLASRPHQELDPSLFDGYQGTGHPRELALKIAPWKKMKALVNGEERLLRIGSFTHDDKMHTVIVLWNSKQELDDNRLLDMPPYSVMAKITRTAPGIEPLDNVTADFRNADGYAFVEGVKKFE
jgi:hypothetical protein